MEEQKLIFKVGPKGGLSVYGLGNRFPVTLYRAQWELLLENKDAIHEFIAANAETLEGKKSCCKECGRAFKEFVEDAEVGRGGGLQNLS